MLLSQIKVIMNKWSFNFISLFFWGSMIWSLSGTSLGLVDLRLTDAAPASLQPPALHLQSAEKQATVLLLPSAVVRLWLLVEVLREQQAQRCLNCSKKTAPFSSQIKGRGLPTACCNETTMSWNRWDGSAHSPPQPRHCYRGGTPWERQQ